MKPKDIRELTDDEIQDRVRELKEERFRLRFRSATAELENPKLLTEIRRDIARMKTVLRERELAQQSQLVGNG
ncbi:MAG: 50S ribosomal protein L29 [Gemmatimonadales bacterium]|jgi:large subunit ribosomal protein L29|nr:MAG: 50S ribosomal protein L29 [Gemmatimonadales bacterium]